MLRPVYIVPLALILGFCGHVQAGDSRTKRGSPDFTRKRWESPIPYMLDKNFNEEEKTGIRAGIQMLIDNTCINFTEVKHGPQVLEYFAHPSKCNSAVGDSRSEGTNQIVNLSPDCRSLQGTQHETMHALGFGHTNNRPDRDDYVRIENDTMSIYNKQEKTGNWTDYGIPYEFSSLIQVSEAIPINPEYEFTAEGSVGMVFNDWKLINLHYKCPEKCATNITCQNKGYLHPHRCNECVCPRFYTGTKCEVERDPLILTTGEPKSLDWECTEDGNINKKYSYEEYLKFPRYVRLIKAPEGTRIKIDIVDATDYVQQRTICTSCIHRAIEIADGDLTRVGKRFCCRDRLPYTFLSETNIIGYHAFAKPGLEFVVNATFTAVDASYVLPPTTTTIPSPTTTTIKAETEPTQETKPPRIPIPFTKPDPVNIILESVGKSEELNDSFPLDFKLAGGTKYEPSEYFRKPDRIIKGPEGTRIRITINSVTDLMIKNQQPCQKVCNIKAISFKDEDITICCGNKNGKDYISKSNVVVYEMYTTPGLDFTASVTFTVVPGPAAN